MEMTGQQLVPLTQDETWQALNDPQVLKECVPGCEAIDPIERVGNRLREHRRVSAENVAVFHREFRSRRPPLQRQWTF